MQKIFRSETDRAIAGVCGGIAAFFKIDSTLVRLVFVVLAVTPINSFVIYFLLWLLVPTQSAVTNNIGYDKAIADNIAEMRATFERAVKKIQEIFQN